MNIEDAYLDMLAMQNVEAPEESLDGMQVAMGSRGVKRGQGPQTMTDFGNALVDDAKVVGGAMADMGAATVKGAAQGFAGLPGDLEGIGRTLLNYFGVNVDDESTVLPTTEEVKAWLDKNVGKVGDGKNPYESIGEITAPGGQVKAGKAVVKGAKATGKALAPTAADMVENGMRKTGLIMDVAPVGKARQSLPELPRVDSIEKFPIGPSSIKPRVIAPDTPLHREMSADNLGDFLRNDSQFSYAPVFVTDNADLALGQGSNTGAKVTFRANSVSGEEHRKPMTGDLSGREYKADIFAPKAIETITFANESDLKKIRSIAARVLQTEFERVTDGKKNIVFVRKAQDKEKK